MASLNASILVVDDEVVVRRVLADVLAQAGYHVRTAESGEAALKALSDEPADLMLLDLQLGNTDGVEVMQIAHERWPQMQVIILTAHGSMSSAIAAVRNDAADYLLKPIGAEALRRRVAEVLARHQASRVRQERIRSMYQQLQALVAEEFPTDAVSEVAIGADDTLLSAGPLSINLQRHLVQMGGSPIEVTPTEFAILYALTQNPGAVVSCRQIVQAFQGAVKDENEARQILRPHIMRLRRKIEQDPARPTYIQSVRSIGYRWGSGEDE